MQIHGREKIDTSRPAGREFMEIGSEEYLRPPDAYTANPRSIVLLLARSMLSLQGA